MRAGETRNSLNACSDIVWAAVLEQTETTGEDRNTIRAVGKARPESEPQIPSRSTGAPIVE